MTRTDLLTLLLAVVGSLPTMRAAETVYFQAGAVTAERWYSRSLGLMKEPSLYQQSTNKAVEQYRFLWLRSLNKPIAVRVRKDSAGITLRVVRLSGSGVIERDESFALNADQWDGFLKLLEKSSFWDSRAGKGFRGRDGAIWVLEGQVAGKYHVVDHHSPSPDDERHLENFVACCRYLLKLSKEEVPRNEDY